MALYLIAFNDEWVPDFTMDELRDRGMAARAVIEEMTVAGVVKAMSAESAQRAALGAGAIIIDVIAVDGTVTALTIFAG